MARFGPQEVSSAMKNDDINQLNEIKDDLQKFLKKSSFKNYRDLQACLENGLLARCFESEWCLPRHESRDFVAIRYL